MITKRLMCAIFMATMASSDVTAAPTIGAVADMTSPFLVANNLQSWTIYVTGFTPGTTYAGFIGNEQFPWNVRTADGSTFFNINSVADPDNPGDFLFEDGYYAARVNNAALNAATGGAARFDSGLLNSANNNPNPAPLGSPTDFDPNDNVGEFARFSEGGDSDTDIAPMAWLSLSTGGLVPPATLNVMRVTFTRFTFANVEFMFAQLNPMTEIPLSITLFPPAPGTLALLLVAGALSTRHRRA